MTWRVTWRVTYPLRAAVWTAAVAAVAVVGATAQVSMGVTAGLNRSALTGSGSSGADSRMGFMLGGTATVMVGEVFSLRPELYFSTKGSGFRTGPANIDRRTLETTSLQLPLLVQLHTGPAGLLRPHLFAGVSMGVAVTCQIDGGPCSEETNLTRPALQAGVVMGAELELGATAVGVRYEAGLRPVGRFSWGTEIFAGVLSFTARRFLYSRERRDPA